MTSAVQRSSLFMEILPVRMDGSFLGILPKPTFCRSGRAGIEERLKSLPRRFRALASTVLHQVILFLQIFGNIVETAVAIEFVVLRPCKLPGRTVPIRLIMIEYPLSRGPLLSFELRNKATIRTTNRSAIMYLHRISCALSNHLSYASAVSLTTTSSFYFPSSSLS